jgi:hypothetical protein
VQRSKAAVVLGLRGGGYGGDKGAGGFVGAFKGEGWGSWGGALGVGRWGSRRSLCGRCCEQEERKEEKEAPTGGAE